MEVIKVHHVLNHTSSLHNEMGDVLKSDPLLLCGGVIEHASGKKLQEVLEEAIVRPLNVEGEMYIGIPPGVESRLATLTIDTEELEKLTQMSSRPDLPDSLKQANIIQLATSLPVLFNTLNVRRAIMPAANGHVTARALARYYAALATGGAIPPPHSTLSKPPLGSHTHIPKFPSLKSQKKKKKGLKDLLKCNSTVLNSENNGYALVDIKIDGGENGNIGSGGRMFSSSKIIDAFTGAGEYSSLVLPDGLFGLGFRRFESGNGDVIMSFGHSGVGGSTGFCNVEHDFSIAITVNKMSLGGVTRKIVQLVCAELGIPVPDEFSESKPKGPDMQIYNVDGVGRW